MSNREDAARWTDDFISELAVLQLGRTFNFYADDVDGIDRPGGSAIRRENLRRYLNERLPRCRILLIGEAPGYRGWRFTGIPFMAERTMSTENRSSLHPDGWAEISATIVTRTLRDLGIEDETVRWATVPLHPAQPGKPLTNRTPVSAEVREGVQWANRLLTGAQPAIVLAVGRIAQRQFPGAVAIRHPAHGGATEFREGLEAVFGDRGGFSEEKVQGI